MVELHARMAAVAEEVEAALDRALPVVQGPAARLHEAMRYAALGGGKRLRPFLAWPAPICSTFRAQGPYGSARRSS